MEDKLMQFTVLQNVQHIWHRLCIVYFVCNGICNTKYNVHIQHLSTASLFHFYFDIWLWNYLFVVKKSILKSYLIKNHMNERLYMQYCIYLVYTIVLSIVVYMIATQKKSLIFEILLSESDLVLLK